MPSPEGIEVEDTGDGLCRIVLDLDNGPPGLVVDGQQRLSALMNLNGKPFEVFVAALVCPDEAELRRQFVLINNTRPLPKSLIYELLPRVDGLPPRLSARARASALTDRMNYEQASSLRGLIRQHTNPAGIISDTAIQKVFMNSLSDGLMREFIRRPTGGRRRAFAWPVSSTWLCSTCSPRPGGGTARQRDAHAQDLTPDPWCRHRCARPCDGVAGAPRRRPNLRRVRTWPRLPRRPNGLD